MKFSTSLSSITVHFIYAHYCSSSCIHGIGKASCVVSCIFFVNKAYGGRFITMILMSVDDLEIGLRRYDSTETSNMTR